MTCYACLFEAKSIQDYILRSGRLRHIVGASELIDSLTGPLLDDVLKTLNIADGPEVRLSRRAGGAVYLFSDSREHRDDFRDLWTLVVQQYAPGLEFIVALGEGTTDFAAYRQAQDALQSARNRQPPALPAGTPITRLSPRTGQPAVAKDAKLGLQDAATARFGLPDFWKRGTLVKRFAPKSEPEDWPRDLAYSENPTDEVAFPFLPDNRYLGLLHADGNGLGEILIRLGNHVKGHPDLFTCLFRDFSEAIRRATLAAAQEATAQTLAPAEEEADAADTGESAKRTVFPARPIVLGGDDITILLRADRALPFAKAFLVAFEQCSRAELTALWVQDKYRSIQGLPEALTAGAGIAFVKSNHPFHLAHELAEDLARFAKDRAKEIARSGNARSDGPPVRIPPTLAFYRVTTASHGDYRDIREHELTFGPPEAAIITTLGAYGIDQQPPELPALADLEKLTALLGREDLARGPARQVLTLIGQDRNEAIRRYRRWRQVMGERQPKDRDDLGDLDDCLTHLCGPVDADLPVSRDGNPQSTPLADVATLLAVGALVSAESTAPQEDAQ
jgi:hypothetical protein